MGLYGNAIHQTNFLPRGYFLTQVFFIPRAYQDLLLAKLHHKRTWGSVYLLLHYLLSTNQLTEEGVPFPCHSIHLSEPLLQPTTRMRQLCIAPGKIRAYPYAVYNLGLWLSTDFLKGVIRNRL